MTDLTKIDRPFGLLDEATQKALRECGGPWEWFTNVGWEDNGNPSFLAAYTYRQKPQPPKPREVWSYDDHSGPWFCLTKDDAIVQADGRKISRWVEVPE